MISNLKKSINSILYERTTSPFYGALIVSWLVWNWKIVYLTLFVSEDKIQQDKITYITENFSCISYLIVYPLISTFIILTLIPFISNGSYWLSLKFEKWKVDKKNEVEKKQLLTLEQSIEIRERLLNQEGRFETLLEEKNSEINQLRALIDQMKNDSTNGQTNNRTVQSESDSVDYEKIIERIKTIDNGISGYHRMLELIQGGYEITDRRDVPTTLITVLEINDIIEPKGNGTYAITQKGKKLTKLLI